MLLSQAVGNAQTLRHGSCLPVRAALFSGTHQVFCKAFTRGCVLPATTRRLPVTFRALSSARITLALSIHPNVGIQAMLLVRYRHTVIRFRRGQVGGQAPCLLRAESQHLSLEAHHFQH